MPEYIERETALNYQIPLAFQGPGGKHTVRVVNVSAIKAIPAADVVAVVRCKDCKHWYEEQGWCNMHSHFIGADGEFCHPWESVEWKMFDANYFCKDGERRKTNENSQTQR